MRVVVVTTSFPHDADDAAGCFVQAAALETAAQGHEVHVIAPGRALLRQPQQRGPLQLHWAGGASLFSWPGAAERVRRAPWRAAAAAVFAAGTRYHLSHLGRLDRAVAHWIVPSAWPVLAGTRVPLDVVAHGADIRLLLAMPSAARTAICAALMRRRASFRFVAEQGRAELLASLPNRLARSLRRHSECAPLPLGLPEPEALRREAAMDGALANARSGPPVVACVGRLVASKRFDRALRAVAASARPLRLVVVGEGPARGELEALAVRLGIAVEFAGKLPRRRALATMVAAQALIHPSDREAAPTVVREARALGVPVVACDAGDVRCWAADDPGLIVSPSTPAALAAALTRAIEIAPPWP